MSASKDFYTKDLEKESINIEFQGSVSDSNTNSLTTFEKNQLSFKKSQKKKNIFQFLWYGLEGVETKGITPVKPEEQTDTSVWNTFFMFLSTTNGIAGLSTGFLAIYYGLSYSSIILIIIFFGFVSCIPVAVFAVFNTGLRQLTLTRFYSGWFTTCYCFCVMNWFSSAGWCSIDSSAAAEALAAINQTSGHNIPQWAALLVLLVGSMTIVFFGYNVIHAYERFAWIATFIVYVAIIVRLKVTGFVKIGHDSPKRSENIGNAFGFISCIFGFSTAWCTSAADFTTYIPKSVPKWKTFLAIFSGMYLGLLITNILGAAICYAILNGPQEWQDLYDANGFGAAVYAVLAPNSYPEGSGPKGMEGFAKFLTIILAISSISMTTGSCYSLTLNSGQIHPSLMKIPRHIWGLIGSLVSFGLSLAFAESKKFSSTFSNIMNMVGYYVSLYLGIFGCELYVFRRGRYDFFDPNDYDNYKKLPVGYASFVAMCVGIIGVFLGMNQSFWSGYIARKISDVGGEIGWILGFGFSFFTYLVLRPFEARYNRKHHPDNYLT